MKRIIQYKALLVILIFIGCKSPLKNISENKKLEKIIVQDNSLLNAVDIYSHEKSISSKKSLMTISTSNIYDPKSPKYLHHINGVLSLYWHPISSYFVHKSDTILVYSKQQQFLNPRNYPEEFIRKMKVSLNDDWTLVTQDDGSLLLGDFVTDHSFSWRIFKGKIERTTKKQFSRIKFLYGDVDFFYTDYDNLDSLRIVPFKGNG